MKRFIRILRRWLLLLVVLTMVATGGLYAYRLMFSYTYDSSLKNADLAAGVKADKSITNILLFGLDTREVDVGTRSDSMMILTVDNTRHKLKLTSLMRDSLVPIEGHGKEKLNHAFSYGGAELAIRTVNQNFGTDITDYIAVDFSQMKELIDIVGGVYVDVSEAERKEANIFIEEYTRERGAPNWPIEQTGYQHLNSVQAVAYARIRKNGTGDDWGRVERQGIVLRAMMEQVKELDASGLITLMQEMLPHVTTSLSVPEMLPLLVGAMSGGKMPELEHSRVPVDGAWDYSGATGAYIVYDLEAAASHLHDYIYNDILPGGKSEDESSGLE